MNIVYVSDGKAGHRAQALGFIAALKRQEVAVEWMEIGTEQLSALALLLYWLSSGYVGQLPQQLNSALDHELSPELIIGVGHRTHWKVLLLQKIYPTAKTLILMKPSLPLTWFDYLIIPKHDSPPNLPHIFASEGVLNPLINEQRHQAGRNLILIGGPSKRHSWSEDDLITQLTKLVEQYNNQSFILTTSRRTPDNFLQHEFFKQFSNRISIYPIEKTPSGWLFEQLQLARHVWVTEDSVSMLYEALTAGCVVHMISLPRLKQDRITAAVDDLLTQKMVSNVFEKPLTEHQIDGGQVKVEQNNVLNEADRAAGWFMSQQKG